MIWGPWNSAADLLTSGAWPGRLRAQWFYSVSGKLAPPRSLTYPADSRIGAL